MRKTKLNNQMRLVIKHLEAGNPDLAVPLLKKMLLHFFMDLDTRKQIEKACDEADIGDPEKAVALLEMLLPLTKAEARNVRALTKRATKPREFHCWLWPDHNIGKRESRQLREEHNALVNLCGLLSDLARAVDAGDFPAIGQAMAALAPYRVSA